MVDARWLQRAAGQPARRPAPDYLQPGGIYRDVRLRVVPPVFIADVFAQPVNVLTPAGSCGSQATLDAARVPAGPADGDRGAAGRLGARSRAATARATITATGHAAWSR